jgi:hypothetical protein
VVLLRKSIPQSCNLKAAAELNVKCTHASKNIQRRNISTNIKHSKL